MTKLPQSTISFNTTFFLDVRLKELVENEKIQSYMYISHLPEEDTKKEHVHLIVVPCTVLNPVALRKSFVETTFDGSLDLGCLPFRTSKISDWILYSIHFAPYLFSKGLVREHEYRIEDIKSNEPFDYIAQCFSEAQESLVNARINTFLSRAMDGASFGQLLAEGLVPPNHVIFYEKLYRQHCRVSFKKEF